MKIDQEKCKTLLPIGSIIISVDEIELKPKHAKCERYVVVYKYKDELFRTLMKKDMLSPKRLSKKEKNNQLVQWSNADRYWDE